MTPTEAIVAHANRQLPRDVMFRELLGHRGWQVPRAIVQVQDRDTAAMWAFSTDEACEAARAEHGDALGEVARVTWLDEALADRDPRVSALVIDPVAPLAFQIAGEAFTALRKLASAVRVERAMDATDLATIRAYPSYAVPYLGVLGEGHRIITVTAPGGSMIAAFTAPDAAHMFVAAGAADDRDAVHFQIVPGDQLFGLADKLGVQGVLVNSAGPHAYAFQLATCQLIAAAAPT
jgi:hypothetical protein